YRAEEVIGQPISILMPSNCSDELSRILEKLKRAERVEHFETARMRKNDKLIYISLTISPIKDAAGNIVGASSIARDITERRLAQKALLKMEARVKRLVGSNIIGILFWDLNSIIVDVNDACLHMLDYTKQ